MARIQVYGSCEEQALKHSRGWRGRCWVHEVGPARSVTVCCPLRRVWLLGAGCGVCKCHAAAPWWAMAGVNVVPYVYPTQATRESKWRAVLQDTQSLHGVQSDLERKNW